LNTHSQRCRKAQTKSRYQGYASSSSLHFLRSTRRLFVASNGIVIADREKVIVYSNRRLGAGEGCGHMPKHWDRILWDGSRFSQSLWRRHAKSAQAYWKIYGEYPPTRVLTQEIATVNAAGKQSGCVRSFRFPSRLSIFNQ